MADKIKVGDVVVLKSGGPDMVVERLETRTDGEMAICTWLSKDKKYHEAFMVTSLEPASPPSVG